MLLQLPATPNELQTIAERQRYDRVGIIKPSRLQGQTLASDYSTRNVEGRRERVLGIDLAEPRDHWQQSTIAGSATPNDWP